jgi:hypothetical protein
MKQILGCWITACVALAPGAAAASGDRWIHVRVDDTGDERAHVDIQVPVGMVQTLLPALNGRHGGHSIRVDGKQMELEDLRSCWNAVRASKDGDYVTVKDHDSDVRVSKSNGFLKLNVNDRAGASKVRMTIPISLVDAVLASGDRIDLDAVGNALAKAGVGELLTVDDEDSHVRIWIDDDAAPAREDRP